MIDRAWSDWTTIVECATCKRVLFRSRARHVDSIPGGPFKGMPGEEKEYQVRPWMALVINRKRGVDYDPVAKKARGTLTMPDGSKVEISERPTVCSRACLHAIDESWARAEGEPGDVIAAELHPATIKDRDDLLCPIVGSGSGPMPESPSDAWIDPIARDRADQAMDRARWETRW